MLKIGLKLWSTNINLAEQVSAASHSGKIDFLELYVVPGSTASCGPRWEGLGCPVILHAPHSDHGFNLADSLLRESNQKIFAETQLFADRLHSEVIVVHGGNGGSIEEAIGQLLALKELRLAIENKPLRGLNAKECIGHTPAQIRFIMQSCAMNKFILDLNHAAHASRSLNFDPIGFIRLFLDLSPTGFHLSDGDPDSETDMHLHLGEGKMPLAQMAALLPASAAVTLETPLDLEKGLEDFFLDKSKLLSFTKCPVKTRVS